MCFDRPFFSLSYYQIITILTIKKDINRSYPDENHSTQTQEEFEPKKKHLLGMSIGNSNPRRFAGQARAYAKTHRFNGL